MAGIGSHTLANRGLTDTWLTPPEIWKSLGHFDLDPCCAINQPWHIADRNWTIKDDGLTSEWEPSWRCFVNPPYGRQTSNWLQKMAKHGNGIALTFARTETDMFHKWVWPFAHEILFFKGRLHFYDINGKRAKGNAGGPSVLIAYSNNDAVALRRSGLEGKIVSLK
jgi:hypothetical protein